MGILSVIESMYYSGLLIYLPHLLGSSPMFTSFTITAFGLYLFFATEGKKQWNKFVWLSFLYPLYETYYYAHYLIDNWPNMKAIYEARLLAKKPLFFLSPSCYYFELVMGLVTFAGVIVYTFYTFYPKTTDKKTAKKLWMMVYIMSAFSLVLIVMHVYNFFVYGFGNYDGINNKFFEYFIIWLALLYFQVWPFYYKSGLVDFEIRTFLTPGFDRYLNRESKDCIQKKLPVIVKEQEFYKDEDITLGKLAAQLKVSVHQLSEYLNKYENMNFSSYINKLRVEEAMRLLMSDEKSIIEICYEIGYNSHATFYKAFKVFTGHTPKEWRKEHHHKLSA